MFDAMAVLKQEAENMVEKSKWSEDEDNLIRRHYKYDIEGLCELLPGRTKIAISLRAKRIGESRRPWTADEDDRIIKCYPNYGSSYCAKYLLGRTEVAIQSRAIKLGVRRKLDKRGGVLPVGDVIDVEKLAYNKSWFKTEK